MLIAVQLFVIFIFFGLAYLIDKKKVYWLISNYAGRSKEEQEELLENGYPQRVGRLLRFTALGLVVLLPLVFLRVPFATEIFFGFMMLALLGGLIILSKYEVKAKRRRSFWLSTVIAVVTLGFTVGLFAIGYKEHDLVVKNETFEITGMYGDEWRLSDIQFITIAEEYPPVSMKLNGMGTSSIAKGVFRVEDLGRGKLFLYKNHPPFIFIELEEGYIYLNAKNPMKTELWYEQLKGNLKK